MAVSQCLYIATYDITDVHSLAIRCSHERDHPARATTSALISSSKYATPQWGTKVGERACRTCCM